MGKATTTRWTAAAPGRAWWRTLLAVVLLMAFIAPNVGAVTTERVVATTEAHVRSCPWITCDVIGIAYLGQPLEVTGDVTGGFYPVNWNGSRGYVYALYVSQGSTAPWLVEGDVSCQRVAFVFNIGIGYPPSPAILDTLVGEKVAASMFPMGSFARAQPAFLRELDRAGFLIGTHGDEDILLTDVTDAAIRADIDASRTVIESVIGRPIDPYHTPYAADTDNRVRRVVADTGLLPVGWRVSAPDWMAGATEDAVYRQVMDNVYPGAIIEFHMDGPSTGASTARALPRIIRDLKARGYGFATVREMADPCPSALPDGSTRTATVVSTGGAGLRCRTAPSVSSAIITVMGEGTQVPVRGRNFGDWVPVTCASQSGWASASYLSITVVNSPPPDDLVDQIVTILIQILGDILNPPTS